MLTLPLPDTAAPPEWIELIPPGPAVAGADGRRWLHDAPNLILSAFAARTRPMVIDWEHATEHRAPHGLDAPAAGWIDRLESRSGSIWGHVSAWTERAAQQLRNREYRFLSPVFRFEKATGRIVELVSAALTNQPNLNLAALNQRAQQQAACRAEFAANAALRAEFADPDIYAAYISAVAAGSTIVGGRVITLERPA